jgi:hypothetical protein
METQIKDHTPQVAHKQTEAEYWAEQYAKAYGGTARRKVRRTYDRVQKKKVKVANRRRFRQWRLDTCNVGTLRQQLRILAGEFGTDAQRARITTEYTANARKLDLTFDEVVEQMRDQLGLEPVG